MVSMVDAFHVHLARHMASIYMMSWQRDMEASQAYHGIESLWTLWQLS